MFPTPALKCLAVAGLVGLAVSACGRRGTLEPPQAPARIPQAPARTAQASGTANAARTLPDGIGLGGGTAEADSAAVRAGDELSPAAVPPAGTEAPVETSRGAKRGYRIPKEPFLLDPLL